MSHNEEAGAHEHGLHLHVHVQRELDAEVVRVGEDLLQQAAPLLADAADGLVAVLALQLQRNREGNNMCRRSTSSRDDIMLEGRRKV